MIYPTKTHDSTSRQEEITKARNKQYDLYTIEEDRLIYIIHTPHSTDFFIWHCRKDRWKASYKRHLEGKRKATADFVADCATTGSPLCFHILEEVHLTQAMAYRHVIAWSEIMELAAYDSLAGIMTQMYMAYMSDYTESVFKRHRNADLAQLLSCECCLIDTCAKKKLLTKEAPK